MAQPTIKRAWVTNQNLSFVAALTFSSPGLGPVVWERACRTSGFLEICSAVSAIAIYCKFEERGLFDCDERRESRERKMPRSSRAQAERSRCESFEVTSRASPTKAGDERFYAVLIQLRNTSATLQACAMQPPAKCGPRASNTSLMVPIPLSSRCCGKVSRNFRALVLSLGCTFNHASTNGPINQAHTVP